jgi:hypothetical protein
MSESNLVLNSLADRNIVPSRSVLDPYPIFHSVAVDAESNRLLMSDSNTKSLLLYDWKSGSNSDELTKPLRQISGPATGMMFIAGVLHMSCPEVEKIISRR